jgi:hypothetical protein
MPTKEITEEQFQSFIKIQIGGKTNMLDIQRVSQLSGLSKGTVMTIMQNYPELAAKYRGFGQKPDLRSTVLQVFKESRKEGFIARANYLCCQSCADSQIVQDAEKLADKGKRIKGCIYWHRQDEDNLRRHNKLYLAYGNIESEKHGVIGLPNKEIGEIIKSKLERVGLKVEWNSNPDTRILVTV